jgi:hypothetical protein
VEVPAQDELDVGSTDGLGQLCIVLQAQRPLDVDVQGDWRGGRPGRCPTVPGC